MLKDIDDFINSEYKVGTGPEGAEIVSKSTIDVLCVDQYAVFPALNWFAGEDSVVIHAKGCLILVVSKPPEPFLEARKVCLTR